MDSLLLVLEKTYDGRLLIGTFGPKSTETYSIMTSF